jgi:hypothetical protein
MIDQHLEWHIQGVNLEHRNAPMTLHYRISALTIASLAALTLSACKTADTTPHDFISDDPGADSYGDLGGEDGAVTTGGEEGGDPSDDDGGEVEISEADIIQLEGDLVYVLSAYAGLTVVDASDPDDLRALGTWETDAEPFEMYVEGAQAFVMFSDYGFWDWDDGLDEWSYNSSSRLVALDASNPADIEVKGEFTLPGHIQDSRRVGDVLYVVTLQDGWCWSCDNEQKTVVTSLDISDEAHPAIVDQLAFTAPDSNWDWQRSVESTTERMYLASRSWTQEGMGSFIDVVDISKGDGTLIAGDQVPVAGSVFSRWQMNEYEGVLRVISQFGWADDPRIETFTIESAQSIVPLGSGNLSLPEPESLRSARFDGERAYAITAEQTDPLFTIDLSDPANPKQIGELEIPGWVYHMETRGDRILALGFDPANAGGSVNVSLFDVSVFDAPTLRKRVHFGGSWADFGEDQNRIHKAFSILDDEQMLLVPFTGWDYSDANDCYGTYRGGVQIIDWLDDDLTLRGLVPARGRARRAFTHRDRILTVSDVQLASFDYADRDAPQARDELSIAVHVDSLVAAGDVFVRSARDWWTSSQLLEIVDAADPGAAEPLGVIELGETEGCEYAWIEQIFAVGDHVFVVQTVQSEDWTDDNYDYSLYTRVFSVDISDPTAPFIDDSFELSGGRTWGLDQLGRVDLGSSWVVQQGDHIVFLMQDSDTSKSQIQVVDIADPSNLALVATLQRPDGQTQGQLSVLSDTIVSWHTEPVEDEPGKVRFYFDRLDASGQQPAWAPKVNVPGVIVAYNADSGRAFTVDFDIEEVALNANDCYAHPKYWNFEWNGNNNNDDGICKLISHSLERLDIEGNDATLLASIDITGDAGLSQLHATDSRIFAKTSKPTWNQDNYDENSALVIVDISANNSPVHTVDGAELGQWWWMTGVDGTRMVLQSDGGDIDLVDASTYDQPQIQHSELPRWGGCYNPLIDGDTVYCPMGAYGLESVTW